MAGLGLLKESLQLLLRGSLLLLHQISVTFGNTPAIRGGQGWAVGTARCRQQLLPVVTTGPKKKRSIGGSKSVT